MPFQTNVFKELRDPDSHEIADGAKEFSCDRILPDAAWAHMVDRQPGGGCGNPLHTSCARPFAMIISSGRFSAEMMI